MVSRPRASARILAAAACAAAAAVSGCGSASPAVSTKPGYTVKADGTVTVREPCPADQAGSGCDPATATIRVGGPLGHVVWDQPGADYPDNQLSYRVGDCYHAPTFTVVTRTYKVSDALAAADAAARGDHGRSQVVANPTMIADGPAVAAGRWSASGGQQPTLTAVAVARKPGTKNKWVVAQITDSPKVAAPAPDAEQTDEQTAKSQAACDKLGEREWQKQALGVFAPALRTLTVR